MSKICARGSIPWEPVLYHPLSFGVPFSNNQRGIHTQYGKDGDLVVCVFGVQLAEVATLIFEAGMGKHNADLFLGELDQLETLVLQGCAKSGEKVSWG